jgi:hypothetical protein
MSFFDGGFLMIVIFCGAAFWFAYRSARNSHTNKASSIKSESSGQHDDDCEVALDDNQYPTRMYGFDGWPINSPKVSIDVDVSKL